MAKTHIINFYKSKIWKKYTDSEQKAQQMCNKIFITWKWDIENNKHYYVHWVALQTDVAVTSQIRVIKKSG